MPSLKHIAAVGVLAAATVTSATACGSSSSSGPSGSSSSSSSGGSSGSTGSSALAGMSADQIVQKSLSDLKAASSVRIAGKVVDSGQAVTLDLTDVAAQGCQGTIAVAASATATGSSAVSGTAGLVVVDGTVYMKLDQSFFKNLGLPASIFAGVTGKYIKLTAKSGLASFAQLCNPSTLSSAFAKEDTGFVKSGTATIGGQSVLAFKQPKHAGSGTVYISDSATPQIVRIAGTASQGAINFSDYNAPATITAPPAGEVVDGSKFGL